MTRSFRSSCRRRSGPRETAIASPTSRIRTASSSASTTTPKTPGGAGFPTTIEGRHRPDRAQGYWAQVRQYHWPEGRTQTSGQPQDTQIGSGDLGRDAAAAAAPIPRITAQMNITSPPKIPATAREETVLQYRYWASSSAQTTGSPQSPCSE